ncbi:MAG: glycosyltransferase family 2 protein [Gemmatimonadota bacterium]
MTPRVSIISPAYNAQRFIERCIESVLAQTVRDWEMLIVDDGSTDRTEERVRAFTDPRIRYFRLPHRGLTHLAEHYNTALRQARGEFIGILEGDDVWLPHKLERQLPVFENPAVVLSWGRALIVDDNDVVSRHWRVDRRYRRDLTMQELFHVLARWNVLSPSLTVMVRRSALEQIGGFTQRGTELFVDLPTWLTLSAHVSGKARYLNEDISLYRIHTTNTGTLHNSKMRLEHDEVFRAIASELGAGHLERLGWTANHERITRASASLTKGVAYMQMNDRVQARQAFLTGLRLTRSPREYLVGAIGLMSAVGGIDLIGKMQKLRAAAAALTLKLTS